MRRVVGFAMRSAMSGFPVSTRVLTAQLYAARKMETRRWIVDCPTPRWRCTSHHASTSSHVRQCARRWPKMAASGSICCTVVLRVIGFSRVSMYRPKSSATVARVADAEDVRRRARRISSRSRA